MRLVTANVEHARRADTGEPDAALLAEALAGLEPDVVALQEVDRGDPATGGIDQARVAADVLGAQVVFAPRAAGGTTGVALLARGTIGDVETLRFVTRTQPERGRRITLPLVRPSWRAVLLARVEVAGRALTVTSAHLEIVRSVSHVQLERVVGALCTRPGPRVLAGDLNRWTPWVAPTVAAGGLVLVADDEPTHPATGPVRRIDHVATAGAGVVSVDVVRLPVGDHRAVVVDLDLAAGAAAPPWGHR